MADRLVLPTDLYPVAPGLETCCVLQPVKSSSTTEREEVNGVLPRSENSYVNYRTRLTLTTWLQRVLRAVHGQPPDCFACTSHSLRKGAAITAYNIGTPMQKIKFYGGWARESDVVLDYIDPTVLPCPGACQLFGWMTPGGAPPNVTRQPAT